VAQLIHNEVNDGEVEKQMGTEDLTAQTWDDHHVIFRVKFLQRFDVLWMFPSFWGTPSYHPNLPSGNLT
jgi:hypothetical protein